MNLALLGGLALLGAAALGKPSQADAPPLQPSPGGLRSPVLGRKTGQASAAVEPGADVVAFVRKVRDGAAGKPPIPETPKGQDTSGKDAAKQAGIEQGRNALEYGLKLLGAYTEDGELTGDEALEALDDTFEDDQAADELLGEILP